LRETLDILRSTKGCREFRCTVWTRRERGRGEDMRGAWRRKKALNVNVGGLHPSKCQFYPNFSHY